MDREILARYNTADEAARYNRKFERHFSERVSNWSEQRLVRRLLASVEPGGIALDAPCGCGRLFPLVSERFERVVEADWSFDMVRQARANHATAGLRAAGFVRLTALEMPFPDRAFDLAFSVRLSHHIREPAERLRYVRELLRVARRAAIFTYFDHDSVKARMRRAYARLNPRKREKWTIATRDVERIAAESGVRLVRAVPISRLFSGHRYALLLRAP